jgi:hypothetical protein
MFWRGRRPLLRLCACNLIVGTLRVCTIHRRSAASHISGKSGCLGNLLARGAMLMGHLRVISDAAIAVDGNANRKGHHFLRFRVDGFGCRRCYRQCSKRLHAIGRPMLQ